MGAYDDLLQSGNVRPKAGAYDDLLKQVKPADSGALGVARDFGAGAVRGAGSIGATLLAPVDYAMDYFKGDRKPTVAGLVTGQQPISRNEERRRDIDSGLTMLTGSDPNSGAYKVGKLGAEIAGTLPVGGIIGKGITKLAPAVATVAPSAAPIVTAIGDAAATGGMTAGGMAGKTGLAVRALGGAINGGASAGLINPHEAGSGALIGGALPPVLLGVGKATTTAGAALRGGSAVSPEVKALAQKAQDLGIEIPADRLVNSKPLNALASSLGYVPMSGRAATEERMVSGMNSALSRSVGQDSDNVVQALRKASDDLGAQFDDVLRNNKVKVDDDFLTNLASHADQAEKELGSDGARIIRNQVDEILAKANNGEIDGQAAYNIKKTLDRIGKRNTPEAFYARDLKQSLMDALNRSLGQDQAAAFAKTRRQYGNMLSLENLAQNGAEGGISIGRLANMKNIKNPELQDLADISAQFLRTRESPHGAMQRVVLGTGALGYGAGAPAAIPYLAAAALGGRAANTALNSNVLKRAMMGELPGLPAAYGNAAKRLAPLAAEYPALMSDQ